MVKNEKYCLFYLRYLEKIIKLIVTDILCLGNICRHLSSQRVSYLQLPRNSKHLMRLFSFTTHMLSTLGLALRKPNVTRDGSICDVSVREHTTQVSMNLTDNGIK